MFILASLLVFNNETLCDFNKRSLKITQGKGTLNDLQKMNPWICENHSIHIIVLKAKELCKSWQVGVAVHCFVALSRTTTLQMLLTLYSADHTIMCSKRCDVKVCKAFKLVDDTLLGLSTTHVYDTVHKFCESEMLPPDLRMTKLMRKFCNPPQATFWTSYHQVIVLPRRELLTDISCQSFCCTFVHTG